MLSILFSLGKMMRTMDQASERISVNIVGWNSLNYLPALFESLDEQSIGFRTILVDNASNDGTASWLARERPDVTVLRNMRNQGFARANNQAIALALSRWNQEDFASRYVILCNPDIEMDGGCLEHLVDFMDNNPTYDACMPKLRRAYLRMTDTEHIKTERSEILDATGLSLTKARRAFDRGAGEPDENQYDAEKNIFGVGGALCCFRASCFKDLAEDGQMYDEDFFAYQEDVDLALRMKRMGQKSSYVPSALAWHHRAAPSSAGANWFKVFINRFKKPPHINYLSTRNHAWLLVKHLGASDLLIHGLWILPYEFAKLIASLSSFASLKGYFHALLGLPKMWKKRNKLKRKERVPAKTIREGLV